MSTTTTPVVIRCTCGHDKNDPAVRPVKRYGWWGQMALIMGFTSRPSRIAWVCETCGTELDSITDPETLERFRYDEPRRGNLPVTPAEADQPQK
jgi:hypothetical protein